MDLTIIIAAVAGLVGLFGWSHTSIRQRLAEMEQNMSTKPNMDQIRILIGDKLAPHRVEYEELSRRIQEIKKDQENLADKVDKVLKVCLELRLEELRRRKIQEE